MSTSSPELDILQTFGVPKPETPNNGEHDQSDGIPKVIRDFREQVSLRKLSQLFGGALKGMFDALQIKKGLPTYYEPSTLVSIDESCEDGHRNLNGNAYRLHW